MHTRTLILLLGLVACALAARGGGGGGRGGRGWGRSGPGGFGPGGFSRGGFGRGGHFGADKPQSCKTDADNQKQCFADNVKSKGVTIDIDSVKQCFESCQRPARPEGGDGARGNRTKGGWGGERHGKGGERNGTRGGGGWGGRHGNGTGANGGNFTQMREQMKTYNECIKNHMGDKQEQCVKGKITYIVATRDEQQQGGKGGRRGGFGGFGNPLKSLASRAEKCGSETVACVRSAMGDWYDKTDELSQILCDASKACPHTTSEACKSDRNARRLAVCQCREEMQPLKDQAQKDCTTDANREFVEKMSQRGKGKGEHKQRSCDAQEDDSDEDDDDKPERPSPFCPRPESKQRFAKRG